MNIGEQKATNKRWRTKGSSPLPVHELCRVAMDSRPNTIRIWKNCILVDSRLYRNDAGLYEIANPIGIFRERRFQWGLGRFELEIRRYMIQMRLSQSHV